MINRRKVFQALQATGADSTMHETAANTLPAIAAAITVDGEYRITEDAVRTAMNVHVAAEKRSDLYVAGVTKALGWLKENGELPAPVVETEEPDGPDVSTGTGETDDDSDDGDESADTDPEPVEDVTETTDPEPVEEVAETAEPETARKSRTSTKASTKKSAKTKK